MLVVTKPIYTIKEAATMFVVSELTIRRYLIAGKIIGFKVGKVWRITQEEINKFIYNNTKYKT